MNAQTGHVKMASDQQIHALGTDALDQNSISLRVHGTKTEILTSVTLIQLFDAAVV